MLQGIEFHLVTVVHIGLLLAILWWPLRSLRSDWTTAVCAYATLLWSVLVLSALLLGAVSLLGSRTAYVATSLAIALAAALLLDRPVRASARAAAERHAARAPEEAGGRLLRLALWTIIVLCVLPTALICLRYAPNNYDTVAYRLPRAFLYMGQGNLEHVPGGDFRMSLYPFDSAFAYMLLAMHGLAGRWMNLFSFLIWIVGGVAVYRAAIELGARRTGALLAATFYISAPAVLVSASSANDDMLAGVPLLVAVLFAVRWWYSGRSADLLFAAMGAGLSAGTKLHYLFLGPIVLLFLAWFVRWAWRHAVWPTSLGKSIRQFAVALAIASLLAFPAIVINVVKVGHVTPQLSNFQNSPFSVVTAATNVAISTATLFFAPIPDMVLDPSRERRQAVYTAFNDWTNQTFFPWVSADLDYSNEPYYRFEGLASSDGYLGVWEQSAWLGFLPWLSLLVLIFAWRPRALDRGADAERLRLAALWLTVAFFSWHLVRCLIIKYVGAAGIYYAFGAALAVPALAWLWDGIDASSPRLRAVARVTCLLVLAGNVASAINAYAFNAQRNVPAILNAEGWLPQPEQIGPELAEQLQASKRTLISYSQWELPLFDLISAAPRARYALVAGLPAEPIEGYDLVFVPQRTRSSFSEIPIQFRNDDRPRLALLGLFESYFGPQQTFGYSSAGAPDYFADYQPPTDFVVSYRPDGEGSGLRPGAGWSYPEGTHLWSDANRSEVAFDLTNGQSSCRLNATAITAGAQSVDVAVNGDVLKTLSIESWFPGKSFKVDLPDDELRPGEENVISFTYDTLQQADGRELALGLVNACVRCSATGISETSAPRQGQFAVLRLSEQRDGEGRLTAIMPTGIDGTDPDEAFDMALSVVAPDGAVTEVVPRSPMQWFVWVQLTDPPKLGMVRVDVVRQDDPKIAARAYFPVGPGEPVSLDPGTIEQASDPVTLTSLDRRTRAASDQRCPSAD